MFSSSRFQAGLALAGSLLFIPLTAYAAEIVRDKLSLLQMADPEMVHLPRSSSVRQHLQAQPAMLAAPPHGLEVEHVATLVALIAQGLGASVVPELALFHFRRDRLKAIPIRDRQLRRPIVLARHKARALSIAARAMFDEVVAQARA